MITTAKIVGYDGEILQVKPDCVIDRELLQKQVDSIEIRLNDGRTITDEQRRKAYAIEKDIANHTGHFPEEIHEFAKFSFRMQQGIEPFSLGNCSVSVAKDYISYLIDFCFTWGVPTKDTLLNQTDDISKYLYMCLEHRRCAVCNKVADVHHIDAVGMGRDRSQIVHKGMKAIALCREHHQIAHSKGKSFFDYYHIYGIKLDDYLCEKLNLRS